MKIGAQFYTIRDYCKTLDDFAESLKKVADIGYTKVQISCVCPYDPAWLKAELDKNGLECVLTHTSPDTFKNDTPAKIASDHSVYGCDHVGLGYFPFNEDKEGEGYADFVRIYKPICESLAENGKLFMYHNHDGEFKKLDGELIMDKIAKDFSPEILGFTLDTFWVQAGGGDPAQWIEKLAGRLPCIHLKDYSYGRKMAAIGDGNINFDRVFEKAEGAGVKYMLVEQDECYGEDPFVCLKRSYDYLKSCGLS